MDAGPISGLAQVATAGAEVGGFAVEDAVASRGPLPLWLAGPLDLRRSGRFLLVAIGDADPKRVGTMFDRGVAAVARSSRPTPAGPRWCLSATGEQATALTGHPGQALGQIAAVTTRAGDRDVVRFFELVRRGGPGEQALRNVFGLEQGELVTLWRSSLERLARSGIR